ncbi:hypothetical protein ACFLQL_00155 [Verrucomicrobiota bacterium]
MGLFNVIKGAYPSLQQIDKTLPMNADATGIVRGSLMYEDAGEFKLATSSQEGDADTPGAYIYVALMDQDDLVAGMAGSIGQGVGSGVPRLTGLAISMPMEIETDQYTGQSFTVGEFVAVGDDGKFVAHATGVTAIGQITKGITTRWANDAVAVAGWRTGNKVNVIRIRTMYIPSLVNA